MSQVKPIFLRNENTQTQNHDVGRAEEVIAIDYLDIASMMSKASGNTMKLGSDGLLYVPSCCGNEDSNDTTGISNGATDNNGGNGTGGNGTGGNGTGGNSGGSGSCDTVEPCNQPEFYYSGGYGHSGCTTYGNYSRTPFDVCKKSYPKEANLGITEDNRWCTIDGTPRSQFTTGVIRGTCKAGEVKNPDREDGLWEVLIHKDQEPPAEIRAGSLIQEVDKVSGCDRFSGIGTEAFHFPCATCMKLVHVEENGFSLDSQNQMPEEYLGKPRTEYTKTAYYSKYNTGCAITDEWAGKDDNKYFIVTPRRDSLHSIRNSHYA